MWNTVLLSDTKSVNNTCPHSDAQNKSAWKAKTDIERIAHVGTHIIIIIIIVNRLLMLHSQFAG